MKKILMIAIPVGVLALFVLAHQSYGFGRFGRHHRGMAEDFIFWKIDRISQELNLNPSQQAKWDRFEQDLKESIDRRHESRKAIHDTVREELSKGEPDLSKLNASIHTQIDQTAQFAHDTVNRINELYTDLTPEQKKLLSEKIQQRIREHEAEN